MSKNKGNLPVWKDYWPGEDPYKDDLGIVRMVEGYLFERTINVPFHDLNRELSEELEFIPEDFYENPDWDADMDEMAEDEDFDLRYNDLLVDAGHPVRVIEVFA